MWLCVRCSGSKIDFGDHARAKVEGLVCTLCRRETWVIWIKI
jgi:hypothetical protein